MGLWTDVHQIRSILQTDRMCSLIEKMEKTRKMGTFPILNTRNSKLPVSTLYYKWTVIDQLILHGSSFVLQFISSYIIVGQLRTHAHTCKHVPCLNKMNCVKWLRKEYRTTVTRILRSYSTQNADLRTGYLHFISFLFTHSFHTYETYTKTKRKYE